MPLGSSTAVCSARTFAIATLSVVKLPAPTWYHSRLVGNPDALYPPEISTRSSPAAPAAPSAASGNEVAYTAVARWTPRTVLSEPVGRNVPPIGS